MLRDAAAAVAVAVAVVAVVVDKAERRDSKFEVRSSMEGKAIQ